MMSWTVSLAKSEEKSSGRQAHPRSVGGESDVTDQPSPSWLLSGEVGAEPSAIVMRRD